MDNQSTSSTNNSTSYSESVQVYPPSGLAGIFGNIGAYQLKALLEVKDGVVCLTRKGRVIFSSSTKDLTVTGSPLLSAKLSNGTILLKSGDKAYKVKFFETSHPFKSQYWHVKMMDQKHNDFIQVLSNLGVQNLPPKMET
jgi:hypothetical protein